MKHLASLAIAAASFALPQAACADLFMHLNFDICEGYQSPYIPIPDLTNRNIGQGYGDFAEGSLNHSLSHGSSGNRAIGYSEAGFQSITTEFNQSWYASYICRFNPGGGGVFANLRPDNPVMHENVLSFSVLPMGVILGYNRQSTQLIHSTSPYTDHFVLTQYVAGDSNTPSELRLWIDPANINDLGTPLISHSFTTRQSFSKFDISCWGSGTNDSLDEVRFGTELSDVAVVPSPATLAPLLGLAMAHRRRR